MANQNRFEPGSSEPRRDRAIQLTMVAFSVLFAGLEVHALWTGSRYKWDFIFIMLMWLGVYLLRSRIDLRPIPYAMLGLFLFLHFAGMFGWYQTYPLGIEYDYWVHGYFGFVAILLVLQAYHHYAVYSPLLISLASLVLILGFSAFHEIFEYVGAMLLGEGEGVLFIGAGDLDEWDTQKDMVNNVLGGILGLIVFHLVYFARRRTPTVKLSN
ncbi:MAG: DUF2238 domain-containing protein [Pirellulales bacterium]